MNILFSADCNSPGLVSLACFAQNCMDLNSVKCVFHILNVNVVLNIGTDENYASEELNVTFLNHFTCSYHLKRYSVYFFTGYCPSRW